VIFNKYEFYERSVQTPDVHVEWFTNMYKDIRGNEPKDLREDFCGTFKLSCEWVRQKPTHTAISIDLDPEPLEYGKNHHWSSLKPAQRKRLQPILGNVLAVTPPKDMIIACNFSFFIFKEKKQLLKYFKACKQSLNSNGLLIMEMAGGPGMITETLEQKTVRIGKNKKFVYYWDQKSFDPISHSAQYSIHFKVPGSKTYRDVFTYDWRLWTIPEIRDLLKEAGFKNSYVYWETEHRGKGTGEYVQMESGDNAFSWVAYVIGAR
jgi:hypothetical protein